MIRLIFAIMLAALVSNSYAVLHENSRGAQVHTPYRWVFADGTARLAQSVVANDTDKVAYQKSDSTVWVLRDNSPVTWIKLSGGAFVNINATGKIAAPVADIDSFVGTIKTATIQNSSHISSLSGIFSGLLEALYVKTDSIYAPKIEVTSLHIIGDTTYTTTFNFYDGSTYRSSVTGHVIRRGDLATVHVGEFGATSVSGGTITMRATVPASLYGPGILIPVGYVAIPYGDSLAIRKEDYSYVDAGNPTFRHFEITYRYR